MRSLLIPLSLCLVGCPALRLFAQDGAAAAGAAAASEADVAVEVVGRRAFLHGERDAKLSVSVRDRKTRRRETRQVPVETRVREGRRTATVNVGGRDHEVSYDVGPDFAPRLPVVAWHCHDLVHAQSLGFTHALESVGLPRLRTSDAPHLPTLRKLDKALADGFRLLRNASIRADAVATDDAASPSVLDFAWRMEEGNMRDFGTHPAFVGALPNSERVDRARPIPGVTDARYRRETGRDVPEAAKGRIVASLSDSMKRFPDGIVPDDDPTLAYLRWWWADGNGWPRVNAAMVEAYRAVRRGPDFVTFWDPAVRGMPTWGAGGPVDVLSQWVYANPEPLAVAGPAEELFAMARGRGQRVAVMTQLICYRSLLAPVFLPVDDPPDWIWKRPKAQFLTIPPDVLQEAVWTMLAKPVSAIMFHGYGTICETGEKERYCFTNAEAPERLKALLTGVVARLGPTLRELPRRPQEVAVLESFASAALGAPFGRGWSAPPVTFLQRARLDPKVVYEQDLVRGGLDGVKALYLPQCRFLTASSAARVRAFQAAGGIVLADAECAPSIRPDVVVPVQSFPSLPKSDHAKEMDELARSLLKDDVRAATRRAKAAMLQAADDLRRRLAGRYEPSVDSSSPELVTFARQFGETPYVFVVNDRRDFGDYVGQWGTCMEKGLPQAGEVSVRDPDERIRAVYELSRGERVAFTRRDGRIVVPVSFDTNDGRLFAFLDREVASVRTSLTGSGRGGVLRATAEVVDAEGRRVPGALPVEMRLFAADGFELSGGGWACAKDGVAELDFQTNVDDPGGDYRVEARLCTSRHF